MRKAANLTCQTTYIPMIGEILLELGRRAECSEVIARVGRRMNGHFRSMDSKRLRSDGLRWPNSVRWARKKMVDKGLLKSDSPTGIWELADDYLNVFVSANHNCCNKVVAALLEGMRENTDRLETILRDHDQMFLRFGGRQ